MPEDETCRAELRLLREQTLALDRFVMEKFEGRDRALDAALKSMEHRLEEMNEFRAAMEDQSKAFLRADAYQLAHGGLIRDVTDIRIKLGDLDKTLANWSGRVATIATIITGVVGMSGVVIYVLSRFWH